MSYEKIYYEMDGEYRIRKVYKANGLEKEACLIENNDNELTTITDEDELEEIGEKLNKEGKIL